MRLSRNLVNWVIAVALGGSLATYQMAPQWHAWWGLMDDAEFLSWAPRGESLPVRDFVATLAGTEIGRFGATPRYRPVYYVLHIAERVVLPASPKWYYAVRTVLFAAGLILCAVALMIPMGRIVGVGILAFVSTEWYWRDIWAHGGPSEQFAFVGASLLAVAGALAWSDEWMARARGNAWLASMGTVLSMGSKENFLILVIPCALVLWRLARAPDCRRTARALLIVVLLIAGAIAAAILPGLLATGTDVNGSTIAGNTRFAWLTATPGRWLAATVLSCAVLPLVSWRLLPATRRTETARATHRACARRLHLQLGLLLLLVISQLTFYAPHWPTRGGRYDFPGMLAFPLAVASLTIFGRCWLGLAGATAQIIRRVDLAVAVVVIALALRHGIAPLREAAEMNTRYTQAMQRALVHAVREAGPAGRQMPIIVEWRTASEAEPAGAVMRLLVEVGCDGPFFLRAAPGAPTSGFLAGPARDGASAERWKGVTLLPQRALPDALAASGGTAMIVTLDDYQVPRIRLEKGP